MHQIEMNEASDEFAECWQAAGKHIQHQAQGPLHGWLKADLKPPFLEHLSFRLGNQVFFIRLEDTEQRLTVPGNAQGLLTVAEGWKGHPCIMPMQKRAGLWVPDLPGWGLVDARNGKFVNPPVLVTEELIEMTEWELHDFAVQAVRDDLLKNGRKIMSSQSNPSVDPSIWFIGDDGPEWVVVRAVRYPERDAPRSNNWSGIAEECAGLGKSGHFASVAVANADDPFDPSDNRSPMPLWRGHGMFVSYAGLVSGNAGA